MIRTIMATALALAVTLPAAPAHAAARARVFVASYGSDSNPCTFGSPCKTFQQAVNVVAAAGEVTAIDSAGFGPITIDKAVTITSPNGVEAGIQAAAGGTAITITAGPNDAVVLRGLTLEGANSANFGVIANAVGKLEIIDCVVRDFEATGILISISGNNALVHISNTRVMNNVIEGIVVGNDTNNNTRITADFNYLTVVDNTTYGIKVGGHTNVDVENSDISHNGTAGGCNMWIGGVNLTFSQIMLRNVKLDLQNTVTQCSINQDGLNDVYLSQVVGGVVNVTGSTGNNVFSDHTNLIYVPAGVGDWVFD
jgi:hypothetical protein